MTEYPILFTSENVRAILQGRKTQTRRLVKLTDAGRVKKPGSTKNWHPDDANAVQACPYGMPGDRLWVRETWAQAHPLQVDAGRFYMPGRAGIPGPPGVEYRVIYRADGEYPRLHFSETGEWPYRERCLPGCARNHDHPEESWHGWTPSVYMPRWACRLVLDLTEVRVERLNDCSEADAKAEGARIPPLVYPDRPHEEYSYVENYQRIWDSINGDGSWALNPWVWVLTFARVTNG